MSLHHYIKEILDDNTSIADKQNQIKEFKESIELAEKIFSGEFIYCQKCRDYFLAKSFFNEKEIIEENVCIYSDPINSSGDEYERKKIQYTYKYCPKGCKHLINRKEVF